MWMFETRSQDTRPFWSNPLIPYPAALWTASAEQRNISYTQTALRCTPHTTQVATLCSDVTPTDTYIVFL